jgi:hypothetical protein
MRHVEAARGPPSVPRQLLGDARIERKHVAGLQNVPLTGGAKPYLLRLPSASSTQLPTQ